MNNREAEQNIPNRLMCRKITKSLFNELKDFNLNVEWNLAWDNALVVNSHFVQDPTRMLTDFDLCRVASKNLNRIRTNCGRCNYWLEKWVERLNEAESDRAINYLSNMIFEL